VPHIGILCPTATGHLNPMCALGRALQRRGHRVSMFQIPECEPKVRAAGLEYVAIGENDFPPGVLAGCYDRLGRLQGLAALRWTVEIIRQFSEMVLKDAPAALREAGVEALVVDQASPTGGTVADIMGLPYVSVANALLFNEEDRVPPWSTGWRYRDAWWARWRNRAAYRLQGALVRPIQKLNREHRLRAGLTPILDRKHWFSGLAQIGQSPAEFDFPRVELPRQFHYTGPFLDAEAREPAPFPYEKLTGRPLIYASMGTLQNRLLHVFEHIARACEGLDAQLVISLGGSADPESLPPLAGSPLVVRFAPQLDLIGRSTLVITHSGQNTVMEALSHGVPMVGIPVTNDQPAVAARLAWTGAGEVVPLDRLSTERLRGAIDRVLSVPTYREHARRLQTAIRRAGGSARAAEVIEQAVTTGRPVVAERQGEAIEVTID
jgi:zeaxanthin glucosyltransferase